MIEHLNVAIIVLALVSIYLGGRVPLKTDFDRIVLFALCFIAFHNTYTFVYQVFGLPKYLDTAFPFSLAYGPLFYVACKAASEQRYTIRQAAIHFVPFLVAFIFFVIFSVRYQFEFAYRKVYFDTLYLSAAASMIGYVLSAIILIRRRSQSDLFLKAARLMSIGITLLASLGLLFLIMTLSWDMPITSTRYLFVRFFIYSALLVQALAVFHYQVIRLIQYLKDQNAELSMAEPAAQEQVQYQKSLLPRDAAEMYEKKLSKLIGEGIFKDPNLSLEMLAKAMGAPRHHITQVLSLRINKGFNQFINEHRVAYACKLLENEAELSSMEGLAFLCGFNSKVSFNRNFKAVTGYTPSQYRELHSPDLHKL